MYAESAAENRRKQGKGMKLGIVDVGGGYRGIYAAGVLEYCMDQNIRFDLGIGVSAGSANLSSFVTRQKGRNHTFYTENGIRKEYAGARNFLTKGTFIDLDYAYSTLSNSGGEYPLDYPTFAADPMDLLVVATDAETGAVRYFPKSEVHQDVYDPMKASCAIPFVCRPYEVEGREYFDGALSNPVPVAKAFSEGCDKVVLLLTKPEDFRRIPENDEKIARLIRRHYPNAAEALCHRAKNYNDGVELAPRYAEEGKAVIVAPDDTCGVNTLTRDPELLDQLYRKGYRDGEKIRAFLSRS